jgi:hypothetical protein
MARLIEWKYVGHEGTPDLVYINGQQVAKGMTFTLPEGYDFTKEYGGNIKLGLRLERVSPPLDPLTPIAKAPDALDLWKREVDKRRGYFEHLREMTRRVS